MLNYISKYIFCLKVLNRLSAEKNRLWRFLPVKSIALRGLGKVPDKEAFRKQVEKLLGSFDARLFDESESGTKEHILKCADEALSHTFNLLGSGPIHMKTIKWHTDFKTGFEWPKKFYLKLRALTGKGADIKVPWELSRCHHLLWLGEAYLITGNEKYSKEVSDVIENWIDDNPLMFSVNWTCAMDVAIRAVNWMFAVNMILSSKNITDKFIAKLYRSLYQHGFFIFHNLEKSIPYSNNHYASDLVGLLYLGNLFKDTKRGRAWLHFSKNEFYMEIRAQILPSGAHYERSVSYHRLMTELFSYPIYMLIRLEEQVPVDIMHRVQSMYNYIAEYLKPNGNAPMIGDNDNGRFLPFVHNDFQKHGYLLDSASIDNGIVSFGMGSMFEVDKNHIGKSVNYNYTDFKILRKNDAYLFVNNGGYSRFNYHDRKLIGTHTHNDLLSFDFTLGEDDVIIDPGTYLYTSSFKDRNEFRSTRKHNTIIVDEEEQNILFERNLFSVERNVNIRKLHYSETEQIMQCNGSYTTIYGKMRHERNFVLSDCNLSITDIIHKTGKNHNACISFHFADGIELIIDDGNLLIDTLHFQIVLSFENRKVDEINIQEDTISPSYGIIKASKTAIVNFPFNDNIEIKTNFKWIKKDSIK